MNLVASKKRAVKEDRTPATPRFSLRGWLLSWEVYLIVLVAAFLRFYQIPTTEFDVDQAMLFRLAQDAVRHGLVPTTSNAASIGISNPPGVIYLFMPLVLPGTNPVWGAVLVALFTTLAAVLTYLFTRRYYGRLAGVIAALLYATAAKPLNYARFIWQPNLMPPFVVLFIFALFLGVVERRKGWFLPALVLFGILYQMHPTTLLLAAPFAVAVLLAPKTFRWRDLNIALLILLVLFSPYLLWEISTQFADIRTVFTLAKQHARIDSQAIRFYQNFLSPYDSVPTYPTSVVRSLAPLLSWLRYVVPLLAVGGFVLAGLLLLMPRNGTQPSEKEPVRAGIWSWWHTLRSDTYAYGITVLLVWQLVPLAVLSRHAVDLHAQYFFLLLPGPFVLIGLLCAKLVEWAKQSNSRLVSAGLRYGVPLVALLVIITQFVGSTAAVIDATSGNFDDRGFQPYPYHNALSSAQNALSEADRLAQEHHFNHVYITTDAATETALRYLAQDMKTPTTLFDAAHCLVIPGAASGPAILLVGPYDDLTNALLTQFANAQLLDQPARIGGSPYRLYSVTPAATQLPQPAVQAQFVNDLQAATSQVQLLHVATSSFYVTQWNMLRSLQPAFRTTYSYALTAQPSSEQAQLHICTFTALRAGDQLFAVFKQPASAASVTSAVSISSTLTVQAQFYTTTPYNPVYGPFHLETDQSRSTPWAFLHTPDGGKQITFSVV